MDPTTLNRNLKPLQRQGLVDAAPDPADGRARLVRITEAGRRRLEKAVPVWRQAQRRVEAALGVKSMVKLNDLLDLSFARLGNQR
jgi:DNA-binding MarR family transcriptional regulator